MNRYLFAMYDIATSVTMIEAETPEEAMEKAHSDDATLTWFRIPPSRHVTIMVDDEDVDIKS